MASSTRMSIQSTARSKPSSQRGRRTNPRVQALADSLRRSWLPCVVPCTVAVLAIDCQLPSLGRPYSAKKRAQFAARIEGRVPLDKLAELQGSGTVVNNGDTGVYSSSSEGARIER